MLYYLQELGIGPGKEYRQTPWLTYAYRNDKTENNELIKLFIDYGVDLLNGNTINNTLDDKGYFLLRKILMDKAQDVAVLLLSHGAWLDFQQTDRGFAPPKDKLNDDLYI